MSRLYFVLFLFWSWFSSLILFRILSSRTFCRFENMLLVVIIYFKAVSSSTSSSWPVCSISSLLGISESYVWSCPVFLARYLISVQHLICWQFPHNCFSFVDFLRLPKDFLFYTLYLPKLPNSWHECMCKCVCLTKSNFLKSLWNIF